MKSEFLTPLDGRWLDDDKSYMLLADLQYKSVYLGKVLRERYGIAGAIAGILTTPKHFVTDFASVPRVPLVYMFFGGKAHHESVPHDHIYQTHGCFITPVFADGSIGNSVFVNLTKKDADEVFFEAMTCRGKSDYVRYGMYWGVVLGGASSYKSGPARFRVLNVS